MNFEDKTIKIKKLTNYKALDLVEVCDFYIKFGNHQFSDNVQIYTSIMI